jgi:hypothetical protein
VTNLAKNEQAIVEAPPFELVVVVSDPPEPHPSRPSAVASVPSPSPSPSPSPPPASPASDGSPAPAIEPSPVEHPQTLSPLQAELIAGAGAVVLLVSLLFLPWFGTGVATGNFAPGSVIPGSLGAWHTLTRLRWLVLVTVVVALLPLIARPASRWLGLPRRTSNAMAALGCLTALLVGFRVLVYLPDPGRVVDQQAGAILGLLGALLVTLGGLELMRIEAGRPRGRQPRAGSRRGGSASEPARTRT